MDTEQSLKIYINQVNEDWIVDRYINEWNEYNYKSVRSSFISDTLIWIIQNGWSIINHY